VVDGWMWEELGVGMREEAKKTGKRRGGDGRFVEEEEEMSM
jgi:hypothetical protein